MIDVVFSDSACGSLKIAQHYGGGPYSGGCVGVIVSHTDGSRPTRKEKKAALKAAREKERLEWEAAVPLGGNPADVYGLSLALSFGDISEQQPGAKRQQALERLYGIYPDGHEAVRELIQSTMESLRAVLSRFAGGETLRIWYSSQPDELCGMHWLLAQLDGLYPTDGQIQLVRLPEWEVQEQGHIVRKNGFGEVSPAEWSRYLALQTSAPAGYCRSCALHWRMLQAENAPLRASLNGRLVSMPESFYDDFILREIAEEEDTFSQALVIGRMLGKYQLGISDSFVALRMEAMIQAGILEAVTDAEGDAPSYHRILRKRRGT
ncbi:MAG: DUF1835 domain-containing protein [Clostridiales bacterium]|nr:DUF1835 domain-containing protein [Clostridiales bacterium]